jgi:hypothetical protein
MSDVKSLSFRGGLLTALKICACKADTLTEFGDMSNLTTIALSLSLVVKGALTNDSCS